jgi:hypothetical protein
VDRGDPRSREDALAYAVEANEYWEKQATEGHCTKLEWFLGLGAPFRFTMVKGDYDFLVATMVSDDFIGMMNRGYTLLDGFAHYLFFTDDLAEKSMGKYGEALHTLGIV